MELMLTMITCASVITVIALTVKILLMQKSAKEIESAFTEMLNSDTNTLIGISSGDKNMRSLANAVNTQLGILRKERHRFNQGDVELKTAVTNISHDLRTPITAICGYLDLLESEEMSENAARYIGIIGGRVNTLKELTAELFEFSVITAAENELQTEAVAVNEVLEESVAAFYGVLTEKQINPDIVMPEAKVIRMLDRFAILRVFSNLLSNAVKYSDGDLKIELFESGKIVFENTASGLSEIEVGKLFDRFYTVDNARSSAGLGLSIAREMINQMNGDITAKYENKKLSIILDFK